MRRRGEPPRQSAVKLAEMIVWEARERPDDEGLVARAADDIERALRLVVANITRVARERAAREKARAASAEATIVACVNAQEAAERKVWELERRLDKRAYGEAQSRRAIHGLTSQGKP